MGLERQGGVPKFYVRALCDIEDFTNKTLEEKPKLNANNQRCLNRMKLNNRKTGKEYGKIMEEYRLNPIVSSSSESEEESDDESSDSGSSSSDDDSGDDSDDESEKVTKKKGKVPAAKKVSSGSESSSSDESGS